MRVAWQSWQRCFSSYDFLGVMQLAVLQWSGWFMMMFFFFLTHVWYFLTSWVDLLAWTVLQGQLGTISWIPETWLRSMWATQRKETKKYKTHDQTTHQVKGRDTSSIHEVGSSWVRTCMVLAPWGMAFTRPSSGPNLRSAAAGRRIWMDAGWSDP